MDDEILRKRRKQLCSVLWSCSLRRSKLMSSKDLERAVGEDGWDVLVRRVNANDAPCQALLTSILVIDHNK